MLMKKIICYTVLYWGVLKVALTQELFPGVKPVIPPKIDIPVLLEPEIIFYKDIIAEMYSKEVAKNKREGIRGYRVQIYGKSGPKAMQEALEWKSKFLKKMPEYKVYTIFKPPDFKVQVGDFWFSVDAYQLLQYIKYEFPYSIIVPVNINLTSSSSK